MKAWLETAIALVCAGLLASSALAQDAPDPAAPGTNEAAAPVTDCPAKLDEAGAPVLDAEGLPVYDETPLPVLNEAGEPVLDDAGAPVTRPCTLPGTAEAAPEAVAETPAEPEKAGAFGPLVRLIQAGGPLMYILAALAILTVAAALVKTVQFIWLGVGQSRFVAKKVELLRQKKAADAIVALDGRRNPVARVMAAAIRGKENPAMDDTLVREETTRVAMAQLDGLERGLPLLSLIATIAPLVGLLGTVLGMIEAFQQMEGVGDRVEPAVLAGGIWQALLTTAAGLSVAIPAAIFYTWLQRAVDIEGQRMEDAATQVFTAPLYSGTVPAATAKTA